MWPFKGQTDVAGDNGTARQDSDIFEHGLTAIAEARSLNGNSLQNTADAVDNQCGQSFAFDVFCNDEQRTAGLSNLFKDREKIANVADRFFQPRGGRGSQGELPACQGC